MLTTAKLSVYYPLTSPHCEVRVSSLNMRAALSRSVSFAAFLLPSYTLYGWTWRGAERLACALTGLLTRHAPPATFSSVIGGSKPTYEGYTMSDISKKKIRTTKEHPFFACNFDRQALFAVRDGIDLEDALSQASAFLASALKITEEMAFEHDSAIAWACNYLVEISKAIVDSAVYSQEFGDKNNGQ